MKFTGIFAAIAAVAFGFTTGAAWADESDNGNFYAGVYHFDWKVQYRLVPELDESGYRLQGGYMFNDYIGVELQAASGGEHVYETNPEDSAELDNMIGVFGRINLPVYPGWVNLFGLFGYSQVEIDVKSHDGLPENIVTKEDSFSLGAGVEVALWAERLYVSADYIEYINKTGKGGLSGVEASGGSIGLRYNF